jgi:hypothetical protein
MGAPAAPGGLVAVGAQEQSDGRAVLCEPEPVVDEGDVEPELPGVVRLELVSPWCLRERDASGGSRATDSDELRAVGAGKVNSVPGTQVGP